MSSAKKRPPDLSKLDFEQSLELAESSIEGIEDGEAGLEEAVTLYEQGMKALARCRELLADAEQRVEDLTAELTQDAPDGRDAS